MVVSFKRSLEPATWMLIAGVAMMFLWQMPNNQSWAELHKVGHSPSTEREVDVNRWKHDGRQPTTWGGYGHGNARPVEDEAAQELLHSM